MIGFLKTTGQTVPSIRLETPRLYLRPPRPRDWRAWSSVRDDSRTFLCPWEPTWPPDALARSTYLRRMRRQIAEWRADEAYSFFLFDRVENRLLGSIGLSSIRRGVSQTASVGYWVGRAFARKGFMTEAARSVANFAFLHLGLHRLEAACLPHNAASRALLTKVGFAEEGHARGYLRIDGAWQDHVLFAMLREDWDRAVA